MKKKFVFPGPGFSLLELLLSKYEKYSLDFFHQGSKCEKYSLNFHTIVTNYKILLDQIKEIYWGFWPFKC